MAIFDYVWDMLKDKFVACFSFGISINKEIGFVFEAIGPYYDVKMVSHFSRTSMSSSKNLQSRLLLSC